MTEQDPGIQGQKLSKSGDNGVEERNKSYNKVLDAQINWIRASEDEADELLIRWKKKSEWHEATYGW